VAEIRVETVIDASASRCFDLARSLSAHVSTTGSSHERVVSEHSHDLLEMGEEVTFEARHFGVRQRLTSRIVAFDFPRSFSDQMIRGAFKSLRHEHIFETLPSGDCRMTDVMEFESPLGFLGRIADSLVLKGYMTAFIRKRGDALKKLAEQPCFSPRTLP